MKQAKYTQGTHFGNYFLSKEGTGLCIRRRIVLPDGSVRQPRYPIKHYKHIETEDKLNELINRLNHRTDNEKKLNIEIRTSFIPNSVLEEFREHLKINIPNEKDFRYTYNSLLKRYFFGFFIGKLNMYDPKDWIKHQDKWGASLLSKSDNPENNIFDKKVVSAKTIKHVIQVANRFMNFLHVKMTNDYPLLKFEPLSLAAIKGHSAKLKLVKNEEVGKFIPEKDWKKIEKELPDSIKPFIQLMYYYGLRRSESLGFTNLKCLKNSYLLIEKQLKTYQKDNPTYSILKDKEQRKTPHWFIKPIETHKIIEKSLSDKMHPDSLSVKWDDFMKEMKMDYKLHDMRRTFITNALRLHPARDVQLSVGHSSLETTMGYAQDDRNLGDDTFDPSKVG